MKKKEPRLFAIPDIHGRKDLLAVLLKKLRTECKLNLRKDKIIFLGDMIDRGPDSKGVIDAVKKLQDKWGKEHVVALAGNHEWLMIDACVRHSSDDYYLWLMNGGGATLKSFPAEIIPDDYLRWCAALPLYHEEPGFFFSHAPVPDRMQRSTKDGLPYTKATLTWTYETGNEAEWSKRHETGVVGVCGHIHRLREGVTQPRLYPHYIFGDAGAGCSAKAPLVAIEVKTRIVHYAWPAEAMETRS